MSLSKSFKKDNAKNIISKSKSDFNYGSNHKFYKGYDESEQMSPDSKLSKMKKFKNFLLKLKAKNSKAQL